ncbi:hypothetical protein TpMuguga_01g02755 [Theileria parva strain Muguga]|uniref:uncharacterized protein n=1 Tax=Theileria parva strain Muguga TaxID=333668 RepID=UPI001C6198D6|nr:uncharacterized protein TpMuguga_01g02755 [Theileria parva strain Muguga]KAF5153394.1 hypothetical protein TpMuguga_01g02755 [Theileria parva strain Muguga]
MKSEVKNWSTNCLELVLVRLDSLDERFAEVLKCVEERQKELQDKMLMIERYLDEINLILDKKKQCIVICNLNEKVNLMVKNYSNNSKNILEEFKKRLNEGVKTLFESSNLYSEVDKFKGDIEFLNEKKDTLSELICLNNLHIENLNTNYQNSVKNIVKAIQIETNKLSQAFRIYQQVFSLHNYILY